MPAMGNVELGAPRCVSAPVGMQVTGYWPWVEISAWLQVVIASWEHRDHCWRHWALPFREELDPSSARGFEPGVRSACQGDPPAPLRLQPARLELGAAQLIVARVLGHWHPILHRHADLRLTSALDEPRESFRRRCLALAGGPLRRGELVGQGAGLALARLAGGIESRVLAAGELIVERARVAVGWYPGGLEPEAGTTELMTSGGVRQAR